MTHGAQRMEHIGVEQRVDRLQHEESSLIWMDLAAADRRREMVNTGARARRG
jgi:hypothetical protein